MRETLRHKEIYSFCALRNANGEVSKKNDKSLRDLLDLATRKYIVHQ